MSRSRTVTPSPCSTGPNAPQTTVTLSDGTYVLDPDSGRITFTARFGFHGAATAVHYRLTDVDDQTGQATYTPTVTSPAGPTAAELESTDVGVTPQTADVAIPTAGSVSLLDGADAAQTTVTVPSGTYVLDQTTGRITFTAAAWLPGYGRRALPRHGRLRPDVMVDLHRDRDHARRSDRRRRSPRQVSALPSSRCRSTSRPVVRCSWSTAAVCRRS